ncbi:MAG: shikimate kinase [Candidatus Omnitrophica bacterium]|nr:shikimate kinase [Candidatus Omnitrophota bacterium]
MSNFKKNIVLIGFMGTGKTSVGKILARELDRPLVDVDQAIEEKEKRKIAEIFEKSGEAYFRAVEKEAVREAAVRESVVITTGGGAVLDPENLDALRRNGTLIALSAKPETIYERVKNSRHRPLLKGEDLLAQIQKLLEIRKPHYEKADLTLDTDGQTSAEVAARILKRLSQNEE